MYVESATPKNELINNLISYDLFKLSVLAGENLRKNGNRGKIKAKVEGFSLYFLIRCGLVEN